MTECLQLSLKHSGGSVMASGYIHPVLLGGSCQNRLNYEVPSDFGPPWKVSDGQLLCFFTINMTNTLPKQ